MFRTKGCVTAIKWQDNKPVTVLSTYHNPKQVTSVKIKNSDGTSSIIPCRVQFNNESRPETRKICNWEALIQMVAPPALLSL